MNNKVFSAIIISNLLAMPVANAADMISSSSPVPGSAYRQTTLVIHGRANAIDGRSLWFPHSAQKVRLANIDACELPQWALDPNWENRKVKAPNPVPCGAIAKAWLKRAVANKPITCNVVGSSLDGWATAQCSADKKDLALEMIRVGWARVATPYANQAYLDYQNVAMANRYGMWATYVLDMDEWRRKAVDRTTSRAPFADWTLMKEREHEISPPFADARQKPSRTDR